MGDRRKGPRQSSGVSAGLASPDRKGAGLPPLLALTILVLLVAAAVLIVHWPVLSAQAASFDDEEAIIHNKLVQNPSIESVKRFFSEILLSSVVRGYYRPLTLTSLMLDWQMGGRPDDFRAFHRTSLALHLISTVLLILLIYQLFRSPGVAALAGLLFGLHPLTVEPIAWVMERKTILAALFAFGCVNAYVRFARNGGHRWYVFAIICYLLSLLAKPTGTPLPIMLLLMDYWPLRRFCRRAIVEKMPFFALSVLFAWLCIACENRVNPLAVPAVSSPLQILLRFCYLIVFYPVKVLLPLNLNPAYTLPDPLALTNGPVLAAVVGAIGLIVAVVISRRWTPAFWVGAAVFYIGLAPTMGIVRYSWVVASDKYVYLPAIGLMLILGWLLRRIWEASPSPQRTRAIRLTLSTLVICVAIAESLATRRLIARWQDTETLYRYMVDVSPRAPLAHNDLALELTRQGRHEEALVEYHKARELAPREPVIRNNLCELLVKEERFEEARQECIEAINLRSWYAEAHNNLGAALIGLGKPDEAAEALHTALQYKPDYAEAHANLGRIMEDTRRFEQAADFYRRAYEIKPDGRFLLALGDALVKTGDTNAALTAYRRGFGNDSLPAAAHRRLANRLAAINQSQPAEEHYREAIRLSPDVADLYNDYGSALARWGRPAEAIHQFRRALDLEPRDFRIHYNLGLALSEEGLLEEAVQALTFARKLQPGMPPIEYALGTLLLRQGKSQAAISCFQRALEADPDFEPARLGMAQAQSRPAGEIERRANE